MMDWIPPWLANSVVVAGALSLFALVIRQIGPWRKQISDMEARLRLELMENHRLCEAELRLVRHRERGSRMMIYSLLHLFDMPLEQRAIALDTIRADLKAMEQAEATETGFVMTAGVGR